MLTKRKDKDGKIIGYVEWVVIDHRNIPTDAGEYVFIRYAWVHEGSRHTNMLNDMFIELCDVTASSPYVYWQKYKCNDRIECFNKEDLLEKVKNKGV